MNTLKTLTLTFLAVLVVAAQLGIANAAPAAPVLVPIPTPTPRPTKPDLLFVGVKCRMDSQGNRWIQYAVKNNTLLAPLGLASGPFEVKVQPILPLAQAQTFPAPNLEPQAIYISPWRPLGAHLGANITLDPANRIAETNENNNFEVKRCY